MKIRLSHYLSHQTLLIAQIIFFLFFFQMFLFDIGKVDGTSMEPNLVDSQLFLVDRFSFLFRDVRRYEVVQTFHPFLENKILIKRVVGLPGEIINIQTDKIIITTNAGEEILISEPYISAQSYTIIKPGWNSRFVIPDHSYFVLGDNRNFSVDSREFGPIHRKYIIGTVTYLSSKKTI